METEDMLSELPICLLVSILSLLSIKDAIKTSVLSRIWRHLFMLSTDLVVDTANIFSDGQDHRRFARFDLSSYEEFTKERHEFVRRVDQFMQLMQGRHIRSLTVCFFVNTDCSTHLDRWLEVAVASGLNRLELFLSCKHNFLTQFTVHESQQYNFPCHLFSETNTSVLSHLRLEKCVMRVPGNFTGFRNLRCLELNNVILEEDFTTRVLPGCLLLEQVTFLWCKIKSTLCFDHPSLPLKHLKVLHGYPEPIIKITCMNLTTLECDGGMMNIAHLYAPRLKEICSLDIWRPLSLIQFSRLPGLEILRLNVDYTQMRETPISFFSMTKLKQLSLFVVSGYDDFELSWVIPFLKASPSLQKLKLTINGGDLGADKKEIRRLDGIHHDQLQEFEIHGFSGLWYEIELLLSVLSRASNLKRLLLSPLISMYAGNGRWIDFPREDVWDHSRREIARKQLLNHVPQGVQLVIL